MLSGISRKRSMRSNPYWFTEFCNSQCLSHFAAPFIVVRAETSVAESCNVNRVDEATRKICECKEQVCREDPATGTGWDTTVRSRPAALEFLHGGIDVISIPTQNLTSGGSQ